MNSTSKILFSSVVVAQALFISACDDSSSSSSGEPSVIDLGMPDELHLSLIDASTGAYYGYDTSSLILTDLNQEAASSQDSGVQKLEITDTSTIGQFLHWPDVYEDEGEDHLDMKYLLMLPEYVSGDTVDASVFSKLVHFHGDDLAAHTADEFENPEAGSNVEAAFARLNDHVADQNALYNEVAEALPAGQQLCRAFVDPYVALEHAHEHDHAKAEEEHGELMHFALTDSGRVYFYHEETEGLEEAQNFVKLDNVSSILDCERTTVARASDDGILIFVPDTQTIYLVDSHGSDYHQHSAWDIAALLPTGVRADLVAILGAGEAHDHDHGDHEH